MKSIRCYLYVIFIFLLIHSSRSGAQTYSSQGINLFSNWYDSTVVAEPFYGIKYNGIWGWEDGNGKEYAIIGATNGTYIVEVTNATNPVLRDFVPGLQTGCIWREYKTYGNYLYMVSDDQAPNGLQIADLSYLPDSVHLVHSSDSIMQRCHTIFIDGNKLYGGSVTGGAVGAYSGMAVFSLANPAAPQLIRKIEQDVTLFSYAHDMFVRNDTIYASAANDGLFILKLLSNNTFSLLASLTTYVDQGYNHSSALTDNGETLIFCDEVPGALSVKALNVSDLNNLQISSTFKSNPGATAHNPFPYGNDRVVIAYYKDGLRIFNISDPSNVSSAGYFDTYWQNDSCVCYNNTNSDYAGCWGAYPYFSGGKIIASDMQNGLFVLDASLVLGIQGDQPAEEEMTFFPNPVFDALHINLNSMNQGIYLLQVFDVTGRIIKSQNLNVVNPKSAITLNLNQIPDGFYVIKISGENFSRINKIIKSSKLD